MEEKEPLSFSKSIGMACDKIVQFSGRSRRSEFWWPMLIVFAVNFLVPYVGWILNLAVIPLTFRRLHDTGRSGWWMGIGIILHAVLWGVLIFDILLAIAGTGASLLNDDLQPALFAGGILAFVMKYIALALVCIIYHIVLLVFLCQDSEMEENEYGPSPKYISEPEVETISESQSDLE